MNYDIIEKFSVTGNCNLYYLDGISNHDSAKDCLLDILSTRNYWGNIKLRYSPPPGGIYLFAQGSEDNPKVWPYGPRLCRYIRKHKLGKVTAVKSNNPAHNYKETTLYIWVPDRKACAAWWKVTTKE